MKKKSIITNQQLMFSLEELATAVSNFTDNVEGRFNKVDQRLDNLEQGQEQIKFRLDNVAYRFELKDLEKRVGFLESKIC